jgi:hypothetical protein
MEIMLGLIIQYQIKNINLHQEFTWENIAMLMDGMVMDIETAILDPSPDLNL